MCIIINNKKEVEFEREKGALEGLNEERVLKECNYIN